MIVLSGALVLVALVLLVVGALGRDLPYVYGSIGVSVLALLLLFLSILQRRGQVDGGESTGEVQVAAGDEGERVPALVGAGQPASGDSSAAPSGDSTAATSAQAPVSRLVRRPRTPEQDEVGPDDAPGRGGAGLEDDPSSEHDDSLEHEDPLEHEDTLEQEDTLEHEEDAYDDEDEEAYDDSEYDEDGEADEGYHSEDDVDEDDAEAAEDEGPATAVDEGARPSPSPRTAAGPAPSAEVLVVAGRPRYHLSGCRYMIGKSPEQLGIDDAQARGFSPCGVCKPDTVLAERLDGAPAQESEDQQPAAEQRQDALAGDEQAVHRWSGGDEEREEPSEDEHPYDEQPDDERLQDARLHEQQSHDDQVEDERLDDEQRHDDAALGSAVPAARAAAPVPADESPTIEHALVGGRVNGDRSGRPDDAEPAPAHLPTDATRQPEPTVPGPSAQAASEPEPSVHDVVQLEPTASGPGSGGTTQPSPREAGEGTGQQDGPPAAALADDGATHRVGTEASARAAADDAPASLTVVDAAAGGQDVPSGGDAPVDTSSEAETSAAAAETAGQVDTAPEAQASGAAAEAPGQVDTAPEEEVPAPAAKARGRAATTPGTAAEPRARAAKAAKGAKAPAGAARAAAPAEAAHAPAKATKATKAAKAAKAGKAPAGAAEAAKPTKAPAQAARPAKTAPASTAPAAKAPRAAGEPAPAPVRTTPVRAVRADALRLTSPTGATTTRRVAVRAAAPGVRPASPAAAPAAGPPAAARTGPGPARSTGRVVVIPDRGRFHRADCRYVRGAQDATTLTKAAAAKQGYVPCGVCQP